MSARTPAKRKAGSGVQPDGRWLPAFEGQREPFQNDNRAAARHGFYFQKFSEQERGEIEEIADALRSALPLYAANFEPTIRMAAARVWRWQRAYAYLVERSEEHVSGVLLRDLGVLERTIQRDFDSLGISPKAAAELGINLARLTAAAGDDGAPFDWNALSAKERRELERLLAKGRADA